MGDTDLTAALEVYH